MQSGREDSLEEQYDIKFCFKLGKNAIGMYGMLQTAFGASYMNRASVFEVNTPQLIGQSQYTTADWPKGYYDWLGLLCWGFKEVQEEITLEEASTLQIGSAAFPPGQYTSPQLHPYHRLFD